MDRATIINHMLSVIGESGVSSVTTTHPSVQTASRILDTEDMDFQQAGWWFNREYNLKLVPNHDGHVIVPQSALDVQMSDIAYKTPREKLRYARRGNRIYDSYEHTYDIDTALYVDLIVQLAITDLPSVAASFLMRKAAEAIFLDDDGDAGKAEKLADRRIEAWTKLKAVALRMSGANALDNPYAMQLQSGIRSSGTSRSPMYPGGRLR